MPFGTMKITFVRILLVAVAWIGLGLIGKAESEKFESSTLCRKSESFLAPAEAPDQRKYAPDRPVQVLHLALDITPDFKARTFMAKAELRLRAINSAVREISLDAVELRVRTVTATRKIQAWQATDEKIVLTFEEPIPAEKETTVTIEYSAQPSSGIYFRTREMGYKEGDDHLFTQGESVQARHWYPCLDAPNQLFTSEITCRVPPGMTAISNGRLVSETKDPESGLLVIHWAQEKRHASYL